MICVRCGQPAKYCEDCGGLDLLPSVERDVARGELRTARAESERLRAALYLAASHFANMRWAFDSKDDRYATCRRLADETRAAAGEPIDGTEPKKATP